jgi:hypothetical protein
MQKIEVIIIGLVLIMAMAFTIVSAETETTYYCYTNGEWGTCTPSEAILAQEAMNRETPRSLSQDEMKTLLSSHEPFWDYYYSDDAMSQTPIMTPVPTPVQAETETTYYCFTNGEWRICTPSEAIIAQEAMNRETPRTLSRDEMNALLSSHEPFRDYYTPHDAVTATPTLTPVPTPAPAPVPTGFWESIIKNRLPAKNYTLPLKWLHR